MSSLLRTYRAFGLSLVGHGIALALVLLGSNPDRHLAKPQPSKHSADSEPQAVDNTVVIQLLSLPEAVAPQEETTRPAAPPADSSEELRVVQTASAFIQPPSTATAEPPVPQRSLPTTALPPAPIRSALSMRSPEYDGNDTAAAFDGPRAPAVAGLGVTAISDAAERTGLVDNRAGGLDGLGHDILADPLDQPAETEVPPELIANGDGTYRADDLVFTAKVRGDGRVKFKDKANVQVRLALPSPKNIVKHLARWAEDPYGTATADTLTIENQTTPTINGSFALTDAVMRAMDMDPYFKRKQSFMDQTRDRRTKMATAYRSETSRKSIRSIRGSLTRIWTYEEWTANQRREALFQLWDECAEDGPSEVVKTAETIRAAVLGFIKRELPQNSSYAYSADELKSLNAARQSKQSFEPY